MAEAEKLRRTGSAMQGLSTLKSLLDVRTCTVTQERHLVNDLKLCDECFHQTVTLVPPSECTLYSQEYHQQDQYRDMVNK